MGSSARATTATAWDMATVGQTALDPAGLAHLQVLQPWIDGAQPHHGIAGARSDAQAEDLVPEGFVVQRTFAVMGGDKSGWVAVGASASMVAAPHPHGVTINVTAETAMERDRLVAELEGAGAAREPADDETVTLWTTWMGRNGIPQREVTRVELPEWANVAPLLPTSARTGLAPLMAMSAAPASGRVIVFHGAPGTGKTTAARALLSAWSSWAHLFLVVDADQLFGDPGYLVGLVAQLRHQREQRPALIVAEDCNDQLTGTTGGTSPTLGRLLNVADGIFGQSTSVIILMTTNAEMTRLHPAITRPGRCLAAVEFERHSPSEAAGLLGRHPPGPLTLAEVLAERGDLPAASRAPSHGSGGYL